MINLYLHKFKNRTTIIILLITSILSLTEFNSCSLAHYMTVNEDRPSDISPQYNSLLYSLQIDTINSFQIINTYLDSLKGERYGINMYKITHHSGKPSSVQIRLYNSRGDLVNGYEQCFGSLKLSGILNGVPSEKVNDHRINFKVNFMTDLDMLNITDKEKAELLDQKKNYDRIIMVFYNRWSGWYSKHMLKHLRNYIKKNSKYKFLFIKIDTAPQH